MDADKLLSALTAVAGVVKEKAETVGGAVAIDWRRQQTSSQLLIRLKRRLRLTLMKVAASGQTEAAYKASAGYNPDAFTSMKTTVQAAVENVNKEISTNIDHDKL